MAPNKRVAHQTNDELLHELVAIRNTIQLAQQSLNRVEQQLKKAPMQSTPDRPLPPARRLLQEVANRDFVQEICFHHRRFGKATNPRDCPGAPECKFVPPIIVKKVVPKVITKPNAKSEPSGSRPITPRQDMDWASQVEQELNQQLCEEELEQELLNVS